MNEGNSNDEEQRLIQDEKVRGKQIHIDKTNPDFKNIPSNEIVDHTEIRC